MNAKLAMIEGQESLEAAAKNLALELSRTKTELECVADCVFCRCVGVCAALRYRGRVGRAVMFVAVGVYPDVCCLSML